MRLRKTIAERLNEVHAIPLLRRWALRLAAEVDPAWSAPFYNLGLDAKYRRRWAESLRFNQMASLRREDDEAIWWNLAIAATALRDWDEARRAWKAAGVRVNEGVGEVTMPPCDGCVRLTYGETVWGERIDPVRFRIENIPLIDSGHRHGDIVLHDGAPNGYRTKDGEEYAVFDELEVWQKSSHSTFQASLEFASQDELKALVLALAERSFGIEDWSSVSILCAACSQGSPEPHEHSTAKPGAYALAAPKREDLVAELENWTRACPGTRYSDLEVVFAA